jgi:cathepsin B
MKFYRAAKIFALDTPKKIKAAILTGGPVESAFTVYKDFMSYKSGVYIQHSNVEMGGHAIKIIGWGKTDKGVDYFIVDNSWGADWGMNGRFWIQVDQCGIGKQGYAGDPDLSKL